MRSCDLAHEVRIFQFPFFTQGPHSSFKIVATLKRERDRKRRWARFLKKTAICMTTWILRKIYYSLVLCATMQNGTRTFALQSAADLISISARTTPTFHPILATFPMGARTRDTSCVYRALLKDANCHRRIDSDN